MAPPANCTFTGTNHPTNALLVCFGHKTEWSTTAAGMPSYRILTMNIYAWKDHAGDGSHYFCIEMYNHGQTGEHEWLSEEEYLVDHGKVWRGFDMQPNKDFNVGGGAMGDDGFPEGGSNKLIGRDGTLKMQAIRDNCP